VTGDEFLCSMSLQNFIQSHRGGEWKSVRQATPSLPCSCKLKGTSRSSACCKGAEQEEVVFRSCILPGQGPRAAPSGTPAQLPQALSDVEWLALTAHSMLPFRPGHFFLTCTKSCRICPSRAVVQPGAFRQLPENTGTASGLSAFVLQAQTITVPSLPAGQLLFCVSLYHLQRVYGSQVASSLSPLGSLVTLLVGASNVAPSL